MSDHAVYSPSGAKKWMTCAGSIAMERGEPNDGSVYSDEGTAAHALASMCLIDKQHPSAFLGRKLHVVNGVYEPNHTGLPIGGETLRTFEVDIDMVAHVNRYVQHILEYAKGNELQVEQRVPIGHLTGEEGTGGTSDAIILTADGAELQVHDLKYGMGVKVFAKENEQGMIYLLGALEANRAAFDALGELPRKFRFVIHQPRLMHLDEWDCTYDELMLFAEKVKERVFHARACLDEKPEALIHHLKAGDHCKSAFCRARATCPALARYVQDSVGADFDVLDAGPVGTGPLPVSKLVPTDLKQLGEKFRVLDLIQDWCKQVRAKAEAALLEYHNSTEVQNTLGIKLVAGKKGNRQWTDDAAVIELLKKMRLKTAEIFDLSVKSPTVITKALKDEPKRLKAVEPFITQKDGQPSVALLDDKREALVLKPAADDFDVLPVVGQHDFEALPDDGSDLV